MAIRRNAPRPWDDVDELELATLSWVRWFNEQRLHSHCGDIPPAEFEAAFYASDLSGCFAAEMLVSREFRWGGALL
jgi:hypothetical protein